MLFIEIRQFNHRNGLNRLFFKHKNMSQIKIIHYDIFES